MVDRVLKAIFLLSPIFYTTGVPVDSYNLIFFHLAVMLLFAASFFDKPKREVQLPVIGAFLVFLVVHSFWHEFKGTVLIVAMNSLVAIVGLRIIVLYASQSKVFWKYMLWGGLINIGMYGVEMAGFNPIMVMSQHGEPGGFFGSSPMLGMYLTLTFPFIAFQTGLFWIVYVIACLVMGEISILFIPTILIIRRFYSKKWRVLAIVANVAVLGGIFYSHIIQSLSVRWVVWKPTIEMIFNAPMYGHGLGIFPLVSRQFVEGMYYADTAFSSFLQFLFATGAPGLLFIGYFMKDFIKNIEFDAETIAMLGLIVLSLVEYPFQVPKLWLTIISIIGFYIIKQKEITHGS